MIRELNTKDANPPASPELAMAGGEHRAEGIEIWITRLRCHFGIEAWGMKHRGQRSEIRGQQVKSSICQIVKWL